MPLSLSYGHLHITSLAFILVSFTTLMHRRSLHITCRRLLSDAFHDYAAHYSTDASDNGSPLITTAEYLETEQGEATKCLEMFEVVRKYEASHTNVWQVSFG